MLKMKKTIATCAAAILMLGVGGTTINADRWYGNAENGYKYQYSDGTYATKGWLTSAGKKYYIKSDGTRYTGWMTTKSGNTYYFNNKGVMATGRWDIGNKSYYFAENGIMYTGNITMGNKTYYIDSTGAIYKTSTKKVRRQIVTTTTTVDVEVIEYADGTTEEVVGVPVTTTETTYE